MEKIPMGQDNQDGQTQIITPQKVEIGNLTAVSATDNQLIRTDNTPRFSVDENETPSHPVSPIDNGRLHARALHLGLQKGLVAEQGQGLAFLLLPVALGLGAGIYFTIAREPAWQAVAAVLTAMCLLAIMLSRKGAAPSLVSTLVLAAVLSAGLLAGRLEAGKATVLLDGRVATTITGRVLERHVDSANHTRYLLQVTATSDPVIRRAPSRVRLVARANHTLHAIGTEIVGRAQLTPPSGPAYPGGYDFARNAYGQGIGAYGFYYSPPIPQQSGGLFTGIGAKIINGINQLRTAISERVRAAVPGDPGALIAALTVSDRGGISDETVDKLRATGLAHILAISGLHMALAAGTFFITLRKLAAFSPRLIETRPVKKYAAVGAILIATAYLLISGAGIPTRRAWLMMVVMFGAVISDRQALTMRNVALAALVIIAISPSAVVTPGFQMSFAATAALIATYDAWSRRRKVNERGTANLLGRGGMVSGFLRFTGGLAMTSLVAGLATGLFAAYHFHQFAAYGLIANLLAMPLVTFLVMPMGLVAMLAMPFGLDYWPLQATGLALEGVVAVAGYVDAMGGDMVTGKMPLWPTVLAAVGFVGLVFLRTRLRLLAVVPLSAGLFLALPPFRPAPPDVLVSEDGRLVGLLGQNSIASNANQPGDFLFGQWQSAYLRSDHQAPDMIPKARKAELADPYEMLGALAALAEANPDKFICADRSTCMALSQGHLIAAIADPVFMGAGCDLSDIVVLSAAIRSQSCRSGAHLITALQLKRTGALAIRFSNIGSTDENSTSKKQPTRSALRASKSASIFAIETALDGVIRPWTIQRYYDWRSDAFDLPDESAGRAAMAADDTKRWAKSQIAKIRDQHGKATEVTPIGTPEGRNLLNNVVKSHNAGLEPLNQ